MKNLLLFAMLCISFAVFGQDVVTEEKQGILDAIIELWPAISTIIVYIIYRLIPTKQADIIKKEIDWVWNLIPDKKKGGGTH